MAGRICARLALEKLGQCASEQVWQGQDRCPVWPAGYCGSISHTNNLAIACVARSEGFRSVGIDVERIVAPQLAESVAALVLLDSDKGFAPDFDFNTFLTIVFSAKEALFKAIYPEVGYVFGFEEAAVLRISKEVVTLEIQRDLSDVWLAKTQVNVLYKVKDSLVYSWAVLKPAYTGTFSAPLDETLQKRPVPVVSGCRK
ncbi:MAG: 4'-phosphopantetheinyl transferase superfamily protein [Limnobacter sp.]|nr:4'-phosphopantetheinyl transferase superfamily protein [Limnobacter sp.]